jgi:hypothetical protein
MYEVNKPGLTEAQGIILQHAIDDQIMKTTSTENIETSSTNSSTPSTKSQKSNGMTRFMKFSKSLIPGSEKPSVEEEPERKTTSVSEVSILHSSRQSAETEALTNGDVKILTTQNVDGGEMKLSSSIENSPPEDSSVGAEVSYWYLCSNLHSKFSLLLKELGRTRIRSTL